MKYINLNKQKGMSLGIFIIVLIIASIGAIFAMKVVPMYIEYSSVKKTLNDVSKESFDSAGKVRESIQKRFSMNYVDSVTREDIEITKNGKAYDVYVFYYVEKPLVGNLSIVGTFEYEVTTQ